MLIFLEKPIRVWIVPCKMVVHWGQHCVIQFPYRKCIRRRRTFPSPETYTRSSCSRITPPLQLWCPLLLGRGHSPPTCKQQPLRSPGRLKLWFLGLLQRARRFYWTQRNNSFAANLWMAKAQRQAQLWQLASMVSALVTASVGWRIHLIGMLAFVYQMYT